MSGLTERTLAVLEYLATQMEGTSLASLADALDIPRSACHRLLSDLKQCGYVRQLREHGDYVLTTKIVGLGLSFLATSGIVDIGQTVIDRLAQASGELVRLSIVDGDRLTWVAKAQGALKGLRYDPDMGMDTVLSCTATGHAWLMTMSDERALELVLRQGFGQPSHYGPRAPTTVTDLLTFLNAARERGFSTINEVFAPGMTALAAPVRRPHHPALAVISIAGPLVRLDEGRMRALGPTLLSAAAELAMASKASPLLSRVR